MTDTIADLINRLNNSQSARLGELTVPYSRLKTAVLDVLKSEGRVIDYKLRAGKNAIEVRLDNKIRLFEKIRRVSKPSRRVYAKAKDIPRPKGGYGMVVVSTPQGVMTGKAARKKGLGGEIICEVY